MSHTSSSLALVFIAALCKNQVEFMCMKASVVFSALMILVAFSCKDKEKIIETVDQKPKDIFNIPLCETLNSTVMKLFTESHDNKEKYPELFSESTQEKIVLTKEADVYISYVTEGAAIPGTLGYYIYTGNDPAASTDIEKNIIFPDISNNVLVPGDTRFIGRFPQGTVLGFFLIVGGYSNSTVNWSKPTFYTNYAWNPGTERQHVLFREEQCNNILIGFEDKAFNDTDSDYNDVVFIVSDNDDNQASTSFDQSTMASM